VLARLILFVFYNRHISNSNDITAIYGPTVIPMLQECIGVARCIIDGELLVWDTLAGRFEDFGKLKSLGTYRATSQCHLLAFNGQ
jgi:ATP-dependent DNA ligase